MFSRYTSKYSSFSSILATKSDISSLAARLTLTAESRTGATENIRITAAEPQRVFDRAAINAVKKWKYKPQIVRGEPIKQLNMQKRIVFEITD